MSNYYASGDHVWQWLTHLQIPFDLDDETNLCMKARMMADFLSLVPDVDIYNPALIPELIFQANLRKRELILDFHMLAEMVFLDYDTFNEYLSEMYDWADRKLDKAGNYLNCHVTYLEKNDV